MKVYDAELFDISQSLKFELKEIANIKEFQNLNLFRQSSSHTENSNNKLKI
jgi:hypothetical protein